jgi:hypothetical protein
LVKVNFGSGCSGKVISNLLQLGSGVEGERVKGHLVLVFHLLGALLDEGLQLPVLVAKSGLEAPFSGRDVLLSGIQKCYALR